MIASNIYLEGRVIGADQISYGAPKEECFAYNYEKNPNIYLFPKCDGNA